MWLGVGKRQEEQREETMRTTRREKQPPRGSSRCPGRPGMRASKARPEGAPGGTVDRNRGIRRQFQVHCTKHRRPTRTEEVTDNTEKEQVTASRNT